MSNKLKVSKFIADLTKIVQDRGDMTLSMYDPWKKDIGNFSLAVFSYENEDMAVMLPTDFTEEFMKRYGRPLDG